jgi:predicted phosphodiesterase
MNEKNGTTNIVREYRQKYGWDMPTLKLARIIYEENKILFKSVESVRDKLRYIEGKSGGAKLLKTVNTNIPNRSKNPYKLPESDKADRLPYVLPKLCNNILLISDLHIPYHDIESLTLAFDYGVKHAVNTIFINGDLLDFHHLSKFQKDPRKRSIKHEFDTCKEFLRVLRSTFKDAQIYWLKGNHDMRYEHWLMTKVYEVFDDEYYHMEQRLRLSEENVHIIDDKQLVKAGKLSITHGHHVMRGFFAPVNSARGAWMKAKQSVLISHVHKVSQHVEVNMDGESFGAWSTGSLCENRPDYSPLVSSYQNGFAHITIDNNDDFQVRNYHMINGKLH